MAASGRVVHHISDNVNTVDDALALKIRDRLPRRAEEEVADVVGQYTR